MSEVPLLRVFQDYENNCALLEGFWCGRRCHGAGCEVEVNHNKNRKLKKLDVKIIRKGGDGIES
jgi:hypothetical protein